MKSIAILYFAAMMLFAIIAGFIATGCSSSRQIPECEWDQSCDTEYPPPELMDFDDSPYEEPLEQPRPKKRLKKKRTSIRK